MHVEEYRFLIYVMMVGASEHLFMFAIWDVQLGLHKIVIVKWFIIYGGAGMGKWKSLGVDIELCTQP